MISRQRSILLTIVLVTLAAAPLAATVVAASPDNATSGPQGIDVEMWNGSEWIWIARAPFSAQPRIATVTLPGDTLVHSTRLRLSRNGDTPAYIDAVRLGDQIPLAGSAPSPRVAKAQREDLDMLHLEPGGAIELNFEGEADRSLHILARIAPERLPVVPFNFPIENTYLNSKNFRSFFSYTLVNDGAGMNVDGQPDEGLAQPLFETVTRPGSGHPVAPTAGWLANDRETLYAAIDFLPDNTNEDDDFATLFVRTADGLRSFTVNDHDSRWGLTDFVATRRASYEHTVYEFSVPLHELGLADFTSGTEIEIAFAAYGTVIASLDGDYFISPTGGQTVTSAACSSALDDIPPPGAIFAGERDMVVLSGTPTAAVDPATAPGLLVVNFATPNGSVLLSYDIDGDCTTLTTTLVFTDLTPYDRLILSNAQNSGTEAVQVMVRIHTQNPPKAMVQSIVKTLPSGFGPLNVPFIFASDFPGLGNLDSVTAIELTISATAAGGILSAESFIASDGSTPVELMSFDVESGN